MITLEQGYGNVDYAGFLGTYGKNADGSGI
jgi:hypothetical protein